MKNKFKLLFFPLVFSMAFIFVGCDKDDDNVNANELPAAINTYISTHFSGSTVSKAEKEGADTNTRYEVVLNNGVKLEFNNANEVVDIDGNVELPDSVIPNTILDYVTENYATNVITGWELEENNTRQQVQLDNGLDLEFDLEGNFLRIDN